MMAKNFLKLIKDTKHRFKNHYGLMQDKYKENDT